MVTVPFPPFEPDKNRYNTGALPLSLNVLPAIDGWAPMPSAEEVIPLFDYWTDENGNALVTDSTDTPPVLVNGVDEAAFSGSIVLDGTSVGGIAVRSALGTFRYFLGTTTKLLSYNFTDYTWQNFSGSAAPYAVPTDGRWSFVQYGDQFVYAQNGIDAEQYIDFSTGTSFSSNSTAPICSYLVTVGDFLLRLRLASNLSAFQWSALNDPTSNDAGTNFSDIQVLPTGGGITGGVPMSFGAVIFCRDAIYTSNLTFDQFVFNVSLVTNYRGAIAPYSICQLGQDDFVFYASDGFFRGLNQVPIGAGRVDDTFLNATTESDRVKMVAVADYRRKVVYWRYRVLSGEYRILGYSWLLDRWLQSDLDLVDILASETPGVTIDGLDGLYTTLNDVTEPIDSSLFDGGAQEVSGVSTNGLLAFLNGPPMQATIQTNELSLNGTNRANVNGGRLYGDPANFTATVSTTDYKGGGFRDRSPVSPTSRTRFLALRADGRTHKLSIVVPEGEDWSTVSAIDLDASGSGKQ